LPPIKTTTLGRIKAAASSFSKTLASGFRVGWTLPGRFRATVEKLKRNTTLANATLPQMAIAEYLQNGGYERHLRRG